MAPPEHEEQSEDLTYDECFDLLSNYRRRYALHYLEQNGEYATISDLAEQVAAWEYDISPEEVSYDERKRVYTSLQQVHLPRMDRMDVVEFDSDQGTVEVGPAAEQLDIYLDVVTGRDIPWSGLYVGAALLNTALFLGGVLGLPLLAAVPPSGWAVSAVTVFLVLSLAHTYLARTEMQIDVGESLGEE
jgi:hypothetical protein